MYDPTETQEITVAEALAELAEEMDAIETAADEADRDVQSAFSHTLGELDTMANALGLIAEEYGPDASIVYRGLHSGEFARVTDRVEAHRQRTNRPASGYHRNVYAAAGLVRAPFFAPEDVTDPPWGERSTKQRLDAKVQAVTPLDTGVTRWLYAKVDDRTTPDAGNWRRFVDSTPDAPEVT